MLRPEYLDSVPDRMVALYAQAEEDIIAYMAERIAAQDYANPSTLYQVGRLEELGVVREEIFRRLSKALNRSETDLQRILVDAGMESLKSDDAIYRRAGLEPPPLQASPSVQQALEIGYQRTQGTFINITATTANTACRQFERMLDLAYTKITSGAFSWQSAVESTIKQLSKDGLEAIVYPSGHVDHLDVAVRRATLTGVNQACGDLQMQRAQDMGCDLVEVTAHTGARPEHAAWQGKIYSISGLHPKYKKLADETGYGTGTGLKGWNCRHDFSPYIEGDEPIYGKKELAQMNKKTVAYNGKKLTEYEARQQQRYYERQLRRWKREKAAMERAGLPSAAAAEKIREYNNVQMDFLEQTGLKRQHDREKAYKTMITRAAH